MNDHIKHGTAVIDAEVSAIQALKGRIDDNFSKACEHLLECKGKIVVIGMGKSGHIGNKIAATLASTGSPSFFVHPAEASHGDLGMISKGDVVLAISNSGETHEILSILPIIQRLKLKMIALTGNPKSSLATKATVNINIRVESEACPLDLAPTSSTTATLAMGDAIAIALQQARGFTANDFALSHPGGLLGKKLLLEISAIMHNGDKIPTVSNDATLDDVILEMTQKGFGMTAITDNDNHVLGIFTDGDLRRCMQKQLDIHTTKIASVMTANSISITSNTLAIDALRLMEDNKITVLLVIENDILTGIVHMHDILQAGLY